MATKETILFLVKQAKSSFVTAIKKSFEDKGFSVRVYSDPSSLFLSFVSLKPKVVFISDKVSKPKELAFRVSKQYSLPSKIFPEVLEEVSNENNTNLSNENNLNNKGSRSNNYSTSPQELKSEGIQIFKSGSSDSKHSSLQDNENPFGPNSDTIFVKSGKSIFDSLMQQADEASNEMSLLNKEPHQSEQNTNLNNSLESEVNSTGNLSISKSSANKKEMNLQEQINQPTKEKGSTESPKKEGGSVNDVENSLDGVKELTVQEEIDQLTKEKGSTENTKKEDGSVNEVENSLDGVKELTVQEQIDQLTKEKGSTGSTKKEDGSVNEVENSLDGVKELAVQEQTGQIAKAKNVEKSDKKEIGTSPIEEEGSSLETNKIASENNTPSKQEGRSNHRRIRLKKQLEQKKITKNKKIKKPKIDQYLSKVNAEYNSLFYMLNLTNDDIREFLRKKKPSAYIVIPTETLHRIGYILIETFGQLDITAIREKYVKNSLFKANFLSGIERFKEIKSFRIGTMKMNKRLLNVKFIPAFVPEVRLSVENEKLIIPSDQFFPNEKINVDLCVYLRNNERTYKILAKGNMFSKARIDKFVNSQTDFIVDLDSKDQLCCDLFFRDLEEHLILEEEFRNSGN